MQGTYRTKMVKHTGQRLQAESVNAFKPLFNGDAFHAVGGATGTGGAGIVSTGSPEGAQTAPPGTIYLDTSTGDLWIKRTGIGNTGWFHFA